MSPNKVDKQIRELLSDERSPGGTSDGTGSSYDSATLYHERDSRLRTAALVSLLCLVALVLILAL